jgi:hypothetical protein
MMMIIYLTRSNLRKPHLQGKLKNSPQHDPKINNMSLIINEKTPEDITAEAYATVT